METKKNAQEVHAESDAGMDGKLAGIRTLKANEIECRIGTINEKGCTLLLYKDARVYDTGMVNLFCTISVYDERKKEWVSKQDVGTESNTEKEKGQASDAFKRAGFNWGIGRELYSAPFIWVRLEPGEISKNTSGRCSTYTKFSVSEIEYDENREVSKCVIIDDKGNERFSFPARKQQPRQQNPNVFTGKQLKDAVAEVKACQSRYAINEVWKKHSVLQQNMEFRNATMEMCKKYPE